MTTITTAAELDALPVGSIVKVIEDDPTAPNSFWLSGKGGLWWTFAATHGYSSAEMVEGWEFTVLYRPDQPEGVAKPLIRANSRSVALDPVAATPSGLPSVEQVAQAIYDAEHDGVRLWEYMSLARAVLALFEAAVPSLPKPGDPCCCTWYSEDRGGGCFESMQEYDPACPEHSQHVYNPRTGMWEFSAKAGGPSIKAEAWDEGWQAAIDAVFGPAMKLRSVPRITYVIPPNPYLTEGAKP